MKSAKGYMASDVQLQILSNNFKHQNRRLQIQWKCNDEHNQQTCSIQRYIEPDTDKALGFHTLFEKEHVKKAKGLFKIKCIILPPRSKQDSIIINEEKEELTQSTRGCKIDKDKDEGNNNNNCNNNNKQQSRKRKLQMKIDNYMQNEKSKRRKVNNHNNKRIKSRPYKNYFIKDDVRFPREQLMEAIKRISNKLGTNTLFDLIPTIDCFSSNNNYQNICKEYITEEQDYFSDKYENTHYWKDKIAWCFPPYHRKTIVDCINSFKRRKIKGYICVPYERKMEFIGQTQRICKEYIGMKARNRKEELYIADKSNIIQRCSFETMIFYFDYQETERTTPKSQR